MLMGILRNLGLTQSIDYSLVSRKRWYHVHNAQSDGNRVLVQL